MSLCSGCNGKKLTVTSQTDGKSKITGSVTVSIGPGLLKLVITTAANAGRHEENDSRVQTGSSVKDPGTNPYL